MRGLVNYLLDMARIDAGSFSVFPEPTDVAALVEQARSEFLKDSAWSRVDVRLPPDLPRVKADRRRMLQVLNNLLSNESRFSPDQSTIGISASAEEMHVAISITYQGRGISDERLPRLFKKSFRPSDGLGASRDHDLSLAICRGIVEAHGGRIWVESDRSGLGARFIFTIPTADQPADVPSPDSGRFSAGTEIAAQGRVRVLAVDDQPQSLRYTRNVLRRAGYSPLVTGNPQEVEDLIKTQKPHLVLLALSGSDRFRLMGQVLQAARVPVIILLASDADHDMEQAFEAGADDYIVKPYSPSELVLRITAALRKRDLPGYNRQRQSYQLGDLTINYAERGVTVAGLPVQLTATEYNLLYELSIQAGMVMTHDQLLERVWGPGYGGDPQPVRTFVKNLRRKVGDDANRPKYIFTEPRVGYRMARPANPQTLDAP